MSVQYLITWLSVSSDLLYYEVGGVGSTDHAHQIGNGIVTLVSQAYLFL